MPTLAVRCLLFWAAIPLLLTCRAQAQSVFGSDTFIRGGGETTPFALESHTPTGGGSWTKVTGGNYTGSTVVSPSGYVRSNASSESCYALSVAPASTAYTVEADLKFVGNTSIAFVSSHINTSTGAKYTLYYYSGTFNLVRYPSSSGAATTLTTGAVSISSGSTVHIKIVTAVSGSNLAVSAFQAGTQIGTTYTDTSPLATGFGGVGTSVGAASDTTGQLLTNFSESQGTATTTLAVTDTNLYWSGNWDSGFTGKMVGAASGEYFKGAFTGTTTLAVNFTPPTSGTIYYGYSLNGGPLQAGTLTSGSTSPLTISTGLTSGATNTLYLTPYFFDWGFDLWGSGGAVPGESMQVTGFSVDTGGSTVSLTGTSLAVKSTRIRTKGDSIKDGAGTEGPSVLPQYSNALHTSGYYLAQGLDAEWDNFGWGGQGWLTGGNSGSNVPGFTTTFNAYNNAHSLVNPTLAFDVTNMGTNGNTTGTLATSGSSGTVRGNMAATRAANGTATIDIYEVPFGQQARAGLLNDLSFYGGGTTSSNGYTTFVDGTTTIYAAISDPKTWVLDFGTGVAVGGNQPGTPSLKYVDGLHPYASTNAEIAAKEVHAIQAKLGGAATTGTKRRLQ